MDWNIASNSELKEECKRLENDFLEKQQEIKKCVERVEELNKEMNELSATYIEVKNILNKREGKTDIN